MSESASTPVTQTTPSAPVTQTTPSTASTQASKPPLSRNQIEKKESVWSFYEKVEVVENNLTVLYAKCSVCSQMLVRGGSAGTSHLRRHWKSHISSQSHDVRTQYAVAADSSGNISNWCYNKDVARKEVVDFVVRSELPFTFVDAHDFTGLVKRAFAPQYGGLSASTCKRDVMKLFDAKKKELIESFENFDGKICLTSDCWSSRANMGYMSITAHFIDKKWNLNKRIIAFKMIEYPHTGESLANHITEELISWRIHRKVFSISLDNATNNDVVAALLPDYLMINSILQKYFHVRCNAHVSNLIVQDGLCFLSISVEKITNIVRSMNSSGKRHELWVNCCIDLNMPKRNIDIDVPHRWNSTYELLQIAEKYKLVLNRYVQKLNQSNRHSTLALPTDGDWFISSIVCRFLKVFDASTKSLCGVYYPTSCRVIPCLVRINAAFNKYSCYPVIAAALNAMKSKFSKYFKTLPPIFCLAAALDPRYKFFAISQWMKSMGVDDSEVETTVRSLKNQLFELHEFYKQHASPVVQSSSPSSNLPTSSSDIVVLPNDEDEDFAEQVLKRARTSNSNSSSSSSDLQYYIDLPTLEVPDGLEFNILGWWRSHEEVYPVLSLIARDLLSVPASTVASEAAFSAGGRVVSEKRASLNPDTIQALICLKDWKLADARKQDKEHEELLIEEEQNAKRARPEYMIALDRAISTTEAFEQIED